LIHKRYGVGLAFTPVLSDGLINMKIEPEVQPGSTGDNRRFSIPPLIVRCRPRSIA
jgi:Flp pilus assembly secretin CpaC